MSEALKKYAVILAGGQGTRLWPLSRQHTPKQFLNIGGKDSLLNETINRIAGIVDLSNILIVTADSQRNMIKKHLMKNFPHENILYEPEGRNTSACIAYAAAVAAARSEDGVMCVLPADHHIGDEAEFRKVLGKAFSAAESTERLVTIGIKPEFPATGYGYIKYAERSLEGLDDFHEVEEFIEKPDIKRAKNYCSAGNYLWNSGIFVWKVSTIQNNLKRFLPRLYNAFQKAAGHIGTESEQEAIASVYSGLQSLSIDYGILERSDEVLVIPASFQWSDIGSWDSLATALPSDQDGNIIKGLHAGLDTTNSIIFSNSGLVTTIGLDGMLVVHTGDAVLICPREKSQRIKDLVERLGNEGLESYL